MSAPPTLLLTETGVESLPDGSTAVNVGPIVRALKFLTEGRGDDRGLDEAGNPLPDLMSLAFDVVESIIVGGRKAEHFRQVKRELDARGDGDAARSSLALAKHAKRVQPTAQATALDDAPDTLHALLAELLVAVKALGAKPRAKSRRRAPAKKAVSKKAAGKKAKRHKKSRSARGR